MDIPVNVFSREPCAMKAASTVSNGGLGDVP